MLIVGIVALVVGALLLLGHRSSGRKVVDLKSVERRKAGELVTLVDEIGDELGQGAYRENVEVVGSVECAEPLTAPFSEQTCVYFETEVQRQIEERREETDSDGNRRERTQRRSETIASETRSCPFAIRDESGTIAIDSDGATYDELVKSIDRFDRGESSELSLGRFVMSLTALASGRRTLGYHYKERLIPLDRPLTVIGQVSDAMGQVAIARGDGRLIISTRSRDEMIGSAGRAATVFLLLAGLFGAAGVALIVAGLLG